MTSLSEEESDCLEDFFKVLITREEFGYTLLGHKPVSTTHWIEGFSYCKLMGSGQIESTRLRKGLLVWRKVQEKLPMKNFLFKERTFELNHSHYRELIFVNLKSFRELKQQHPLSLRKFELEHLLQNDGDTHKEMGMAFGYGERNAHLFCEKNKLNEKIGSLPKIPDALPPELLHFNRYEVHALKNDGPASGQNDVIKQYLNFQKIAYRPFSSYKKEHPLCPVRLPAFMADHDSQETEELYQTYSKGRKELTKLSQSETFLQTVLSQLCEE